ncbi:hypothetical protein DY000_02006800 [Brassica cretica]|nr:hypothetical protein DY000_02006800 [Brassica cretica]
MFLCVVDFYCARNEAFSASQKHGINLTFWIRVGPPRVTSCLSFDGGCIFCDPTIQSLNVFTQSVELPRQLIEYQVYLSVEIGYHHQFGKSQIGYVPQKQNGMNLDVL